MLNPKLFAEAFPINKVEVFFDAEDHSNFLGFQWEKVSQGRIPIGLDDDDTDFNTIGKTGGEKEVILTVEQTPAHDHRLTNNGNNDLQITINASGGGNNYNMQYNSASASESGPYVVTTKTGGGKPHNNMPPYIVMAFWRRIA